MEKITINIKEHENLYHENLYKKLGYEQKEKNKEVSDSNLFKKNKYSENKNSLVNAYYIGVDWLIENELALIVNPKINIDYLKMFMECFKHPEVSFKINNNKKTKKGTEKDKYIYKIHLDKKPIPLQTPNFEITPLLIIHFLKVLERIVKRGLKKDYIRIKENLSSKIKGKILFSKHLKKNVMQGRADRVYCDYQDYSVDCIENQVLKKALFFCQNYLSQKSKNENLKPINQTLIFCKSFFTNVSDIKQVRDLKQFRVNKLYRDYDQALKLAKMILKRFGYNTQKPHQKENKIPPFWINMALLFEMYVLAKLKDRYKEKIKYQEEGNYGIVDFLKTDEKIIIDTKYKKIYNNKKDIRQLSGYARDEKITGILGENENTFVPCCIIYPKNEGVKEFTSENLLNDKDESTKIKGFTKFHKIGIQLPILSDNS